MSEKDVGTNEVLPAAPEEAAPAEEGERLQETCADPAQVAEDLGTQTPPLKGPETPQLTDSPATGHGDAEAATGLEPEEGEHKRALRAASLRAQSPSPEFQSVGSTPSPERTPMAEVQPEFEGDDMVGTSSPVGDDNVYATPATTPPPAPEGEDGSRTPPGTLFPFDEPQLRVSPKKKVENMDLDADSCAELPTLQKKARAGSRRSSASEEECQWDSIPPPPDTEGRLAGRLPWGSTDMVLGRPFPEDSRSMDPSPEGQASKSECAAAGGELFPGDSTSDKVQPGETESLYSAASDLTQVMTLDSPSQPQPIMMGVRPKSSCSVYSRHSDFRSPPRENATEPYRTCAGRMMLDREDWTHYAHQDEVRLGDFKGTHSTTSTCVGQSLNGCADTGQQRTKVPAGEGRAPMISSVPAGEGEHQ